MEGYEDLDQLFRRSISPEGELVYYPVVLKEVEDTSLQGTYQNDEPLVVHYQEGETQTLTAEAFEMYDEPLPERTVTEEVEGIPVLRLQFFDSQGSRERRGIFRRIMRMRRYRSSTCAPTEAGSGRTRRA